MASIKNDQSFIDRILNTNKEQFGKHRYNTPVNVKLLRKPLKKYRRRIRKHLLILKTESLHTTKFV